MLPAGVRFMFPDPVLMVSAALEFLTKTVFTLPASTLAVTLKLPNVPTLVMLVCVAVCKVPVKLVANTLPVPLTSPAPNNTLPPVMFAVALIKPPVRMLPPVMLPVPLTTPDPNMRLPPVTFEVALIRPPVNKLAPVTLPVPDTSLANTLPVPLTIPAPNSTLPPMILVLLVMFALALIKPAVRMLPPVILAALVIVEVALIKPAVRILPAVALPVADISPAVKIFPPVMLPVTDTAAGLLTTILPIMTPCMEHLY